MGSAYQVFGADAAAEKSGVLVNYGDFRVRIARAGGSNHAFRRLMQARLKPYRHQLDNETMDEAVSDQLLREVYAQTVIMGWESKRENGWEPVLDTPDGPLPYTVENAVKVLTDLPDLFKDLQSVASKAAAFRRAEQDADAKN